MYKKIAINFKKEKEYNDLEWPRKELFYMKKSILKFGTVVATITSMILMIACNTNIDNENKKTQTAKQDKINSIVEGDLTRVSPDSTKLALHYQTQLLKVFLDY